MGRHRVNPFGLTHEEWRAFWISLGANAVLFLLVVIAFRKTA